jgi:predicted GNAT family acetyltransferase
MSPIDDDKLDETLDETFPASDPPANTVETGIRIAADSSMTAGPVVRDRPEANRLEAVVDGQVAFLQYERRPDAFVLAHTEVPASLRGKGVASALAKAGLALARSAGLPIVVRCPFVRAYLQKHRGAPGA